MFAVKFAASVALKLSPTADLRRVEDAPPCPDADPCSPEDESRSPAAIAAAAAESTGKAM
jgi:hypothetical protein